MTAHALCGPRHRDRTVTTHLPEGTGFCLQKHVNDDIRDKRGFSMFGRDGRTYRADQLNMTEGSVLPLILRFALPIFVGSVFQQIYSVVDTMMAGHVLGVVGCAITWLFVRPILQLMTGTGNADILYWGSYNLKVMSPFFPVLGVLVILRTGMQAMGQKLAPVISSVTELLLRFLGGIWMIPTFGYPGGAWNTPITWCAMTA